ncbi:EscU/YscU/HrcU family type III secretion system export apparatus switch protein [Polymorphum gilvum]|uniref:Cytoplasmic domain of flagellar protein FhlB-like protein n=1 Tax=Polymorphum gilvum (strain LMG 25793 / CGMCC 1.9160 / SL003B-26A1) TaxID=991905 RepID=F2J489_POLGS|nr:EscU/YscU/HrcU family type III secretion system export apparatus switch protein [Polymorphum gilvum]ADZ71031.1 Cytoplasmic domain of flagellar protein FhlB-like protein [Polymorphum gilvum SL003B-26A1]
MSGDGDRPDAGQEEPAADDRRRLAVALHYDKAGAPTVTAKGRGAVARRIEETARAHGVPIEADPLLAEALAQIEIDQEIPVELYQAVAVLIGFILRTGTAPHAPR